MDNGLENLFRILKEMNSCNVKLTEASIKCDVNDKTLFLEELSKKILEKRQNLIVTKRDEKTKEVKEFKKDHLILQEGKKVDGKVDLKEDLYKPGKTSEIISNVFNHKKGDKTCILCRRFFDKSVKKLQQASYPYVTKIASLSGERSYKDGETLSLKDYYDNFCPLCYLTGILEWTDDALAYRTFPGEKSYLFLPHFDNLKELNKFKELCVDGEVFYNEGRYSNIRVNVNEVEYTPGEYSTLLCFYEKFIERAIDEITANNWVVLHIPYGSVKNIKSDLINIQEGIIGVIKELREDEKLERIYSDMVKRILFFSENKKAVDWEISREVQEKVSKSFLLDDFRAFTNSLLPRKGGYISIASEVQEALEEFIFEWRWKNMGVQKDELAAIKSVGNIIAKVSRNNASLLFRMDKARSLDEFWSVLREISRKIPGMEDRDLKKIRPKSLDELIQLVKEVTESDRDSWREIRDLVVVYSSMYYAIDRMSKGGESNEGN